MSNEQNLSDSKEVEQYYICDACRTLFKKRSLTYRQLPPIHSRQGSLTCCVCRTKIDVNGDREEQLVDCNFCDKRFSQESDLRLHLFSHICGNVFVCPLCPKLCVTRTELHTHLRVHTGERPYVCEICQKTFMTFNVLNRHLQTHDAKSKCDFCDKRFDGDKNMSIHVMRSHPEKKKQKP